MTCIPAPSCKAALLEATHRWPRRATGADGICASAQHHQQNPNSDHEVGNAFDLTHDPANGVDTYDIADRMRLHPDPRVKYVISNRRIWNPSISPNWRPYTGLDPHTGHLHCSILASGRDNTAPWWAPLYPPTQETDVFQPYLVTIPPADDQGRQFIGHDKQGHHFGPYHDDAVVNVRADDNGKPVPALVQAYGFNGELALTFCGLDGGEAPQRDVIVVIGRKG